MNSFIAWYLFYLWPQATTNDMQYLTKRYVTQSQSANKISIANPKGQQNYEYLFLIQDTIITFTLFKITANICYSSYWIHSTCILCWVHNPIDIKDTVYPIGSPGGLVGSTVPEHGIRSYFLSTLNIPILFIEIAQIISRLVQTSLF